MRKALTIPALILAVGILAPASAPGKAGGTDRPFTFTMSGTAVVNLATGTDDIALTGHATHLGKVSFTENAQLVPIGPGVISFNSTWTFVAANGDQLSGGCVGQVTTDDFIHFLVKLDCAGNSGTGRFEDATVTSEVTVHVVRDHVEGTISYNDVEEAVGKGTISY